ncbi:MAG: hypothetical protein HUJ75_05440 [Parasporobacterium sp.]|nr:hypothetical protein [Parasporobacterium sp.]
MKTDSSQRSEILFNIGLSLALTALFVVVLKLFCSFTYAIVDDPYIDDILRGAYTGEASPLVYYIKMPLAVVLSGLYRLAPAVNWHFLLQEGSYYICILLVNYRIFSNVRKKHNRFIFSLLFMAVFFLCFGNCITTGHYSLSAGFLCAGGVFWFLTIPKEITKGRLAVDYIISLVLLWLGYCLRANTLFMVLPVAGIVWIFKALEAEKVFCKKNVIRFIIFPLVLFIGVGGIELINRAEYKQEKWADFESFNDARTQLYDFYTYAPYEGNEEFYESLGISELRYDMIKNRYYLEFMDGTAPDALEQIAEKSVNDYNEAHPFGERLLDAIKALPGHLTKKDYFPESMITAVLLIALFLVSMLAGKWRLTLGTVLAFGAWLVPWVWMIYMNKPVPRVCLSLFGLALMSLLGIIINRAESIRDWFEAKERNHGKAGVAIKIIVAVLCFAGLLGWSVKTQAATEDSMAEWIRTGNVRAELEAYTEAHPENLYIAETNAFIGLGYNLDNMDNSLKNLYWPGGWSARILPAREIWDRYGIESIEKAIIEEDNIYLVSKARADMSYWVDFYSENYVGVTLTLTDKVFIDDYTFYVYKLSGESTTVTK